MVPTKNTSKKGDISAHAKVEMLELRAFECAGLVQRYRLGGSGPHCIVHPGGPGIDWHYIRMPELERYFTMVYVEPVGTRSAAHLPTHPKGYDVAMYTRQVEGILDHLACDSAVILGHSHGGFVAQNVALMHPGRVRGLVLYDTAPTSGLDLFVAASGAMQDFGARHANNPEADDVLQAWAEVPTVHDDASYTTVLRRLFPAYFANYWAAEPELSPLRASMGATHVIGGAAPFDSRDSLGNIDVPTLVLAGRFDFICGTRWASELHAGVAGSSVTVFESSGHFAHVEQAHDFAKAVVSFARDHHLL